MVVVVVLAAVLFMPHRPLEHPTRPLDRAAAWKMLGIKSTREQLVRDAALLATVKLDSPPVVGRDYDVRFPPDQPFDTRGWTTNRPSPSVANPNAPHGGTLRLNMEDYPPTIRTEGPNTRLLTLADIHGLIYEPMLNFDMALGDYVPALADFWQIGSDRRTYRFHLNPRARWADGRPVTSDDVVATFEHLRRTDRKDPETARQWDEYLDTVKAVDRHILEVHARKPYWRIMYIASQQPIYPAAYIRMDGDTYLTDWNWKLPPGTGPYELRPDDLVKGESITLRRRHDYWDENDPSVRGTYNFEAIRWDVIRDEELTYQKFLAGELDVHLVLRAQRWVDELDREKAVKMGWVQRRRIYEREPQGYGGFAFNMRVAPFNDRNVREAFARLFNRELLFAKFFFYQYEYMDSYFPGQIYARPDARPLSFDPDAARALLAKSGWSERDGDGYLINDQGQRFPVLELDTVPSPTLVRLFLVVQTDLWEQAGIKMNVVQIDSPSLLKKVWDNKFQLVFWNWTASLFPDMEAQFGSKYAEIPQSNNISGLKNTEVDAILEKYKVEFDQRRRVQLMRQLDALLFDEHPYALSWYAPYHRIIYWDRFGHPPEYGDRYVGNLINVIRYWWFDDARGRLTAANKAQGLPNHPRAANHQEEAIDQRWWLDHALPMEAERTREASARKTRQNP